MTLAWAWIFKRLAAGTQMAGLFGYLSSRDRNKTRIKLEKARQEATKEIIDHLPSGAVYREGTSDGWREIVMPQPPQSSLFVVPVEQREHPAGPGMPVELPQSPRALEQHDSSSP
jgi:hypothetical protein